MSARDRRSVTIYYKRLETTLPGVNGINLEDSLRQALDLPVENGRLRDLWSHRCWTDPKDEREHTFINHHQDDGNLLFGDLVCFTRGRAQALLAGLGAVAEVDIAQFDPPEQQEFLNAMLFWMVRGNHVFIIQSTGLRSEGFERYLTWLLGERAGILDHSARVMLVDELNLHGNGSDNPTDVKSLSIGGRFTASDLRPRGQIAESNGHLPTAERVERRDLAEIGDSGDESWVRRVLAAVLGDYERVNATLRRLPEDARLKVLVRLGYERPKRDVDRTALRDMLIAARNLPDSDLSAETRSGRISGDKIRLTHSARVLTVGDLLDRNDVKRAMVEAYRTFVDNGKIDP